MTTNLNFCTRRGFLGGLAVGAVAFTTPGAFAEELVRTAAQTEGPFYPDKLPLDTDNDLIILNDALTPAVGTITHLTGKILDAKGNQVQATAVYARRTLTLSGFDLKPGDQYKLVVSTSVRDVLGQAISSEYDLVVVGPALTDGQGEHGRPTPSPSPSTSPSTSGCSRSTASTSSWSTAPASRWPTS